MHMLCDAALVTSTGHEGSAMLRTLHALSLELACVSAVLGGALYAWVTW